MNDIQYLGNKRSISDPEETNLGGKERKTKNIRDKDFKGDKGIDDKKNKSMNLNESNNE